MTRISTKKGRKRRELVLLYAHNSQLVFDVRHNTIEDQYLAYVITKVSYAPWQSLGLSLGKALHDLLCSLHSYTSIPFIFLSHYLLRGLLPTHTRQFTFKHSLRHPILILFFYSYHLNVFSFMASITPLQTPTSPLNPSLKT